MITVWIIFWIAFCSSVRKASINLNVTRLSNKYHLEITFLKITRLYTLERVNIPSHYSHTHKENNWTDLNILI